jgi:hypothetical protein
VGTSPRTARGEIVVGNVSPRYVLVQHQEFLDAVSSAMDGQGYALDSMHGVMTTTNCRERIELTVELTALSANPPDGFPLECRLRCLNSVDGATALEAELQWYRQICSNGMFGWGGNPVRQVHRFGDVLGRLHRRLERRFEELPKDRLLFSQLTRTAVPKNVLRDWVDVFLARRWGRFDAARTYHICISGKDGHVLDHVGERLPHELEVMSSMDVPGACAPAQNVYHIGQALSWVAGQATTMEKRFSQTSAIPNLLRYLLN